METCEKEETEMTCTTLNNMEMACGRYHHQINSSASVHEVEGRACVPKQDCHWIGMSCRAIILAGGDCEYSCCDEDFCNNVSSLSADNCLIAGGYFCGLLYLYKLTFSNWSSYLDAWLWVLWLTASFNRFRVVRKLWLRGIAPDRILANPSQVPCIRLRNLANWLHEKKNVGFPRRVLRLDWSRFFDCRVILLAGQIFLH